MHIRKQSVSELIYSTMSCREAQGVRRGECGLAGAARYHGNRPRLINCRNMYDPLPA